MKRMISLALCSLSLAAFAGRVYTWTGAQDSRWTNPANWTVDGAVATACPGVVSNEVNGVFAPALPSSDTAVFDSAGAARTTVDLEGLYSVAHVRVTGGRCAEIYVWHGDVPDAAVRDERIVRRRRVGKGRELPADKRQPRVRRER